MNALDLKTEALCWLRFGKKMEYVCTEGGYWEADVLGLSEKFAIEVEVKMSRQDLKREFRSKASKHYLYNNVDGSPSKQVPNYFYFYVPAELEAAAMEIIGSECPKAGLAIYEPFGWARDGKKTRVAKRPTKLHDTPPTSNFIHTVLLRMGSELCGRYLVSQVLHKNVAKALAGSDELVVELMQKMVETPDIEDSNGN